MKNDINILKDINRSVFHKQIKIYLSNNLSDYLISSLSNMLAIDYVNRLKQQPQINEYVIKCVNRLKSHLKHLIILDEDFSSTMSLFAIAITEEKESDNKVINTTAKNQDILIESIIAVYFGGLPIEEQKNIQELLKDLLGRGDNNKDIINFVGTDPRLFYSIVIKAHMEKTKQKEITEFVAANVSKVINDIKAINKKKNNIKSLAEKVIMSTSLIGIASAGAFIGGATLPAMVIPLVVTSLKVGPAIGERIGELASQTNANIQKREAAVKNFIMSVTKPALSLTLSQAINQKKSALPQQEVKVKLRATSIVNKIQQKDVNKENIRQR